nr:MAG TPA: Chromatin remodeling complex ATPase [Caudoviricetes sp.]
MANNKYNFPDLNNERPVYDFSWLDDYAPEPEKNNDDDGILSAAYHGVAGATGSVIRAGGNLLNYAGKPAYLTEEEWDKQMQADGGLRAFTNRTNKKIEEFGKEVEDAHARSYSDPFSAASIANAAASVIPYAIGLGLSARVGAPTVGEQAAANVSASAMATRLAPFLSKISGKYGETVAANAPKYMAPIIANLELGQKQALPEAVLESVTSGKLDYIDNAKRNGTYVPGVTEQEAEQVAKGVLTDNLMFITGTDTMQDALIQILGGKKAGKLKKAATAMGVGGGINSVQEMGQQIIPKMESGQDWSLTDPDILLSGLVGGLTGGVPAGVANMYDSYGPGSANTNVTPSDAGTTPAPGVDVTSVDNEREAFINAIGGQESGGNYNAVNGRTGASGKYQIMPENWSAWAQEAGLSADAPMTPENQEIVARHKLGEYYDKYGARGAAMAWYAGEGSLNYSEEALNRKQGKGNEPSINEYADQVLSRMGKTGSNAGDMGIPTARQAKSFLQQYLENDAAAGDEYNAVDTILGEGSDKDIIAKAIELGYGKQNEAEPPQTQQPVTPATTPEEQIQTATDNVNSAVDDVVNGGEIPTVQQPQVQPQQPPVQVQQPVQPQQTTAAPSFDDHIMNLRKTVDRIAKNKGEGAIKLTDEDAARYAGIAGGDNIQDLISAAESLKIKIPRGVKKEVARRADEERGKLRGDNWARAEAIAINNTVPKSIKDKHVDPATGIIRDGAFDKNRTAKAALNNSEYDGLGTRAMNGDEEARAQLRELKKIEQFALIDRARRAALGEGEDKAPAKAVKGKKAQTAQESRPQQPLDDSEVDALVNKKRETAPADEALGDKKHDGTMYGLPIYKSADGGVKYLLNEKAKKVRKMGKGIDEWHDFDSAEAAKEFIAKDGAGEAENTAAADKGGDDNNGGKTNETDKNGTGSKGDDKGSENPVQNKQSEEPVKAKTGDDKGEGENGEAEQVEKPKKKEYKLSVWEKSGIDQGIGDIDILESLFGDHSGEEETSKPVKSKDDEDVERVITDNILVNESKELGERENAYNAIVEKFAESNPKAAEALGKYLTKHPEMRDLLIDMFDKHPQLLTSVVKDKKAKSGERTVYYVVYDGNEKPVKIPNSMADIISAFDGKETATLDAYTKQQKAQKQQEEPAEEGPTYISEIPEDATDDFLESVQKEYGKEDAAEAYDLLFSDSPIQDKDGNPLTWDEVIRQAVFRDLQLKDNKEYDKLVKQEGFSFSNSALGDCYWTIYEKHEGRVKPTTRGGYKTKNNLSIDDIMAIEEATKGINDPTVRDDDVAPKTAALLHERFPDAAIEDLPSADIKQAMQDVLFGKKQQEYQDKQAEVEKQRRVVQEAEDALKKVGADFGNASEKKLKVWHDAIASAEAKLEKAKTGADAQAIKEAEDALSKAQDGLGRAVESERKASGAALKAEVAKKNLTKAREKLDLLTDEITGLEKQRLAEDKGVQELAKKAKKARREANEALNKAKTTKKEEDQKAADAAAKRAKKAQADLQAAQGRVLSKLKGEEKEKQQEEPVNQPETEQQEEIPQVKISKEAEDGLVNLLNGLGEMNLKFKADDKQSSGMVEFKADLFDSLLFAGSQVLDQIGRGKELFRAWAGRMKQLLESAAARASESGSRMLRFAQEMLRAAHTFLLKLPDNVKLESKGAEADKRRQALFYAGAAVDKNITPSAFKKMLQQRQPALLEGIKDYIDAAFAGLKYYPRQNDANVIELLKEINGGGNNEPIRTTGTATESNSGRRAENGVEGEPVSAVGGSKVQSQGENSEASAGVREQGRREPSGDGSEDVHGSRPVAGGTRGNQQGSSEVSDSAERGARNLDSGRSSGADGSGQSVSDKRGEGASNAVSSPNESKNTADEANERLAKQREIKDGVPIKVADKANIAETLPVLLPEQQQDVLAVEDRFFGKNKVGILVANGTGTGKTLVGLGAIKRFLLQGKKNILIVVPSAEIGNAWAKTGSSLLQIDNMARITNGKPVEGVPNIITYAALTSNKEIQGKNWDLILCDEAHHIISGSGRSDIGTLEDKGIAALALRGLFGHKADGFDGYIRVKYQDLFTKRKANNEEIKKLEKVLDDTSPAIIQSVPQLKKQKEKLDKLTAENKALTAKIFEAQKKEKPKYDKLMESRDSKVLLLSATPFAYPQNAFYGEGLLFNYADSEYGGSAGGFLTRVFGFTVTSTGKIKPRRDSNGLVADNSINEIKFHDMLVKSGAMISRRLEIDKDYNRQFIKVDDDGTIQKIEDGFKVIDEISGNTGLGEIFRKRFDFNAQSYVLESVKAKAAVDMIKSYISRGKKVVLFHDRVSSANTKPFVLPNSALREMTTEQKQAYELFQKEHPELVKFDLSQELNPVTIIKNAFGDKVRYINGQEKKADRARAVDEFNDDNSGIDLIMVTSSAGQEGISLHDTTGVHPRVLINLGMPVRPTAAIQIEGRIYRYGSKSNAMFRYLATDSKMERIAFNDKIATRSKTAENIALGTDARALDIAFQSGFMQVSLSGKEGVKKLDYTTDEENSGGKAKDSLSRKEALIEFNNAANASGDIHFKAAAERLNEREKADERAAKENAAAAEDAAKRKEILTPQNKGRFKKAFAEAVHAKEVVEVADGVYVATLWNGRNLWLDTNTSQAAVLAKMSDEQKRRMLNAANIKGSGFEIQGFYNRELRNGGIVDMIHLTEAVKEGTLDHETMHFVFNVLLTSKEREDLMRYYKWRLKREMGEVAFNKLSEQELDDRCEELIADQYAAFAKRDKETAKAPLAINNIAKKILWKVKNLLAQMLDKIGLHTPNGIYLATRSGKMFNRGTNESGRTGRQYNAAMYKNKASDFPNFKEKVLSGEVKLASKTYFAYNVDGQIIRIAGDAVNHVEDEHHLTDEEWIDALDGLSEPEAVYYGNKEQGQRGKPMVFKTSGSRSSKYGVVLEFSPSGEIYLKTLYKGTDSSIDDSIKKRGAAGRFLPDGKSAVPNSHPLSIYSVQQGVMDVNEKEEQSYSATEQSDGKLNFKVTPIEEVNGKALPDDLKAVLKEANKFADEAGAKAGEITVKHKTMAQGAKDKAAGIADMLVNSPSRLAEKNPIFNSFYKIYSKAQETQEKLRARWRKQFQTSITELKSAEDMNNFVELMMTGEMAQKEYTLQQLKDAGYNKNVRNAYSRTRQLIRNVWEAVNDAHRGLEHIHETVSGNELNKLAKEPFLENIQVAVKWQANGEEFTKWKPLKEVNVASGGEYEVRYDKPKVYTSAAKEQLTAEQLKELQNSPYAQVTNIVQKHIGGEDGATYFEAKVKRTVPPIGKITGYLPHLYEQWMVLARTEEGLVPVGSGKTLKEAYKVAEMLQKNGGDKIDFQIAPKLFDANNVLGGGEDAKGGKGSLVVSDAEYIRLQRALVDNAKMSVPEARKVLEGAVSRTARNRFFGNLAHRKGRVGYNSDVITTIDRYLLSSSRYCALQPAKSKATKLFERTFGRFDKEYGGKEAMANIIKRYMRYNNGTPNYLEQVINTTLAKNDWIVKHVNAEYGDRLGVALASRINGFLSKNLLGCLNISSALVGVTQLVNTYGLIGSYTGTGMQAAKRMNMTDRKILAEAGVPYNIGLDTPSGFSKRRNAIEGRKESSFQQIKDYVNAAGEKGMFLFKKADEITRKVTTLGAYYQAIDEGKTHKQAIAYAKKINREANFDYGAADAPGVNQMISGTVFGDLALLFQKYPMKEWELMRSLIPYFGKGTKAQKARFWATYFLMAGFAGLPGGDWLDELLEKWLGYKPSTVLKEELFKHMGDTPVTRTIIYGIFSNLGIDISRRVGMGGMFPDSDSLLGYALGPAGSVAWNGINSAASGDYIKATKALNPALGNIAEAVRGYSTNSKGQVSYKYKGTERYLKSMGFRPVGQSVEADMTSALYTDKQRSKDARQKLLMEAARKRADGIKLTDEELTKLRKAGVTGSQLRKAVKDMQMSTSERMKQTLNKKQQKEFAGNPLLDDD